jgi:hypothetical protein
MNQHMLLPFERPNELEQAFDDHHIEVTIVAGDYQLLLQQNGCKSIGEVVFAERNIEEMAELKHFI